MSPPRPEPGRIYPDVNRTFDYKSRPLAYRSTAYDSVPTDISPSRAADRMFADAQREARLGTAPNGGVPPYNPNRTFGRGGGPADFPPSSSTSPHRPGVYQEYKMSKNTAKSGEIQR